MKHRRKHYKAWKGKNYRLVKFHGRICHASIFGEIYKGQNGRRDQTLNFLISVTLAERPDLIQENVSANNAFYDALKSARCLKYKHDGGHTITEPITFK